MATVQIRNLDEDAYDVLKARAATSGRSLQEYLRLLLEREARRNSIKEMFDRIQMDPAWWENTVTVEDIVADQRADRAR